MNDRVYRRAFLVSLVFCMFLATSLVYVVLHRHQPPAVSPDVSDPVVARGPEISPATRQPQTVASAPTDTPLAPVQLSPARLQQIGVTTAVVELQNTAADIHAPGNVDIDEQRVSYVQTRFPGWIQRVFVNATYQYVSKGQRLFTIYSPDLVSTEQEYLLARQNQTAFSANMQGVATQESDWLLQAAEDRLRQFDVPSAEIAKLKDSGKVDREIAIDSPASGFITERNALPNAYVQPDMKLYTIADLSTVWVYANVFQNDVGRLHPGETAQVIVDAYPGRKFAGLIDQILPQVDAATRTVRVRLVFSNPGVVLKPGMYVNVDISIPLGRQLVMPASGVLQAGARQIAFLDRGQGVLEPREIETGPQLDDLVVVLKGLKAGDRIVSSANFLVDSEAQLQAALGSFNPLPQNASFGDPQPQQIQIELTTKPALPHKGSNIVHVKLVDADGKPVAGARVAATFYMPAMPGMGMAAMHTSATLAEKSQGIYEGLLELDAGGTWQVTIAVQHAGQTIATKQLSVGVTGGM